MHSALKWVLGLAVFHGRRLLGAARVTLHGTHWWHFALAAIPVAAFFGLRRNLHLPAIAVLSAWEMLYLASIYREFERSRDKRSDVQVDLDNAITALEGRIVSGLQLFEAIKAGEPAKERVEEWKNEQVRFISTIAGTSRSLEFRALYDCLPEDRKRQIKRHWDQIPQLDVPFLRTLIDEIKAGKTPVRSAGASPLQEKVGWSA